MYFANVDFITIFIYLILFLFIFILYIKIILNNRKKIIIIGFTFLLISFNLSLLSLLGPKGSIKKDYIIGNNISFILDVSQSMDAELKGINKTKLELSKKLIKDYINKNINNNYSLTIFAGNALNVIPFVSDIGVFKSFLFGVNKNNLNKSGTDILNALKIGLLNYKNKENGIIILITDGGEDELNNLDNLKVLFNKKKIKLIIVGIGNLKGAYIPVGFDKKGNILYKYDDSKKVVVYLSKKILNNVAKNLKGTYIEVIDEKTFSEAVNNISKQVTKSSLKQTYNKREDLTIYFIFISFIFFLLYFIVLFISKFGLFLGKKD